MLRESMLCAALVALVCVPAVLASGTSDPDALPQPPGKHEHPRVQMLKKTHKKVDVDEPRKPETPRRKERADSPYPNRGGRVHQ